MKKDELAKALGNKPIKRASGNFISTETAVAGAQAETSALSHNRTNAKSHQRTDVDDLRIKRGYALDLRLIDRCKTLGIRKHKKLYEIMEEAITHYLEEEEPKPLI
jgi:hypothetical protein